MMNQIYKQVEYGAIESKYEKALFCLLEILTLLQLSSILCLPNHNILNWNDYSVLWRILSYMRTDILSLYLISMETGLKIVNFLYITMFFLALALYIQNLFWKQGKQSICYILTKLLIVEKLFNLPLLLYLMASLKWVWFNTQPEDYPKSLNFTLQKYTIVFSYFSVILSFIIAYSHIKFGYESRHSHAFSSIKSKVSSFLTLYSVLIYRYSLMIYLIIPPSDYIFFLSLIGFPHLVISILYLYYLPYYNFVSNFIKTFAHTFTACICSALFISYNLENGLFTILAIFVIYPCSTLIWWSIFSHKIQSIKDILEKHIQDISNEWEFEICIRDRLIKANKDHEEKTLKIFEQFFNNKYYKKTRRVRMWKADFLFYVCNKERASLLCINLGNTLERDIETDYQEFILLMDIKKAVNEKCEEYKLVNKLRKYENIKQVDKDICEKIIRFWRKLILKPNTYSELDQYSMKIKNDIDWLTDNYFKLTNKYQDSILLLALYSSFIQSFFNDTEKAMVLNTRRENLIKQIELKENKLSFCLHEENALLMFSASPDVGAIVYSSPQFSSAFGWSQKTINDKFIGQFFPESFKFLAKDQMIEFKKNCIKTSEYINDSLVMLNSKGYLIEVTCSITLLAYVQTVFLVICKPFELDREIALVNKIGVIEECSEGLRVLLGDLVEPKGLGIENFICLPFKNLKKETKITIQSSRLIVSYNKIKICRESIRLVHFYKNKQVFKGVNSELSVKISNSHHRVSFCIDENPLFKIPKEPETASLSLSKTEGQLLKQQRRISEISLMSKSEEPLQEFSLSEISEEYKKMNIGLQKIAYFSRQASRSLVIFKAILIFSMLIVVASNISGLIYFTIQVQTQVSQKSIDRLGACLYLISNMGETTASIQRTVPSRPDLVIVNMYFLKNSTEDLQELLSNFTSHDETWSFCKESENLFLPTIPVINFVNNKHFYEYLNMYNFIRAYLENARNFIQQVENKTYNFNDEAMFVLFNGLGQSSKHIHKIINEIKTCEKNNALNLQSIKLINLSIGFIVMGLCIAGLIPYSIFIENRLIKLWKFTRKIAKHGTDGLEKVCNERLENIHSFYSYAKVVKKKRNSKKIKAWYALQFISRLGFFVIITTIFYVACESYFYKSLTPLLVNRPELLFRLTDSRVGISNSLFYAKQTMLNGRLDIKTLFPEFIPMTVAYRDMLEKISEGLKNDLLDVMKKENMELIGSDIYEKMFESETDTLPIMHIGFYPAVINLLFETFWVTTSMKDSLFAMAYQKFNENANKLGTIAEENLRQVIDHSRKIIEGYISDFIIFSSCFSLLYAAVYIGIYSPFLSEQKKKVDSLTKIAEIIVLSNDASKDISRD
ncbi:hypothetical protein SteCoe_3882 [Stentor coeruleus]|uniref:TmcB/TmcC TPR repeats domain-containing protein n=1 Tax=Stentor coeruleus TaxID=5963 RepID=A0A1R2CW07_9CILI|nr:hypothetical protein SteCoe_3882 [Stentor coeruleus]